jgi:hypothetical protein
MKSGRFCSPLWGAAFVLVGCGELAPVDAFLAEDRGPGTSDPSLRMSRSQIVELYGNVSCESMRDLIDFLDQTGATDYFRGLSGTIRSPEQSCMANTNGRWHVLDNYLGDGTVQNESKLFLSTLDVPTRRFTEGFPTLSGDMVKNDAGVDLLEYFHLSFRSELKLGDDEEEGLYELAVLADDGARLSVDGSTFLESTGVHPTKLLCAPADTAGVVDLRRSSSLPIKVEYFQGPRHHIALQLLWRKVDSSRLPEPRCGQLGNEHWFNYNATPVVAKAPYQDLLDRGWSVIPAHVFRIPRDEYMNPCTSDHVQDVINEETCTAAECEGTGI